MARDAELQPPYDALALSCVAEPACTASPRWRREVLMVIAATSPPTRDFLSFVSEYIHDSVCASIKCPVVTAEAVPQNSGQGAHRQLFLELAPTAQPSAVHSACLSLGTARVPRSSAVRPSVRPARFAASASSAPTVVAPFHPSPLSALAGRRFTKTSSSPQRLTSQSEPGDT